MTEIDADRGNEAANVLPPVQAPAGRFFVQLFLVPMLIVGIIVGLWVVVASIARMGTDPETLVADIERDNSDSWRKALTLAQQLRDPDQEELRNNTDLAGRLGNLLERHVGSGGKDRASLLIYLCSALGKFEVATGVPALVKAANTENEVEDVEIRLAALQAIGTLAQNLDDEQIAAHPEMRDSVLKATHEYAEEGEEKLRRQLLRSTATYVLGVFPGEAATDRLAELIHDPILDVGYNATIGLARRGDERAFPMLVEMLDPPDDALIDDSIELDPDDEQADKKKENRQEAKRHRIIETALRSIAKMHVDHPASNVNRIRDDIVATSERESVPLRLQLMAKEVLRAIE